MIGRRSRDTLKSSSASEKDSKDSRNSEDSQASDLTMAPSISRQESAPTTPSKSDTAATAMNQVNRSESNANGQLAKAETNSNGQITSRNTSQEQTIARTTSQEQNLTRTSSIQYTGVAEETWSIRSRIIRELDDVDDHHFECIDYGSYLNFIDDERLVDNPRKGSEWDQVLQAAEFFGVQICQFGEAVSNFVPEDKLISHTALANCQLLLELGHENATALKSTFDVLYQFGFLISQSLQKRDMFGASRDIKAELGGIFGSLVRLVGEIAIYYRTRIDKASKDQVISIDIHARFGKDIDNIWRKKERLASHLWSSKLHGKHQTYSIEHLHHKLSPVDQSAEALVFGWLADRAERVEGTCEWIEDSLISFFGHGERTFTITGASGCGKSMLTNWIKERLQQPLGDVSYETLSYTFASDAKSEASPIAFLKGILAQLLDRNVGDIHLYESLIKAFEGSHNNAELEKFLWESLKIGLKTVQRQSSSLVIIVDALDEVVGHESAAQLHKRLHECVGQFDRVRAITVSKPISHLGLAGCKQVIITPDHNEHDISLYLHESLAQNHHFNSQDQAIRHELVEKLAKKARGSFLWAYLVAHLLNKEHSHSSFSKTSHDIHGDLHAVLHKVIEHTDLKNATTRLILEFISVAERPLTVGEMEELLSIDLHNRTIGRTINVRKHITTHLSSLVVIRNGLIRFKHPAIRHFFLHDLSGKTLASHAAAHAEITQRLLFYVKYHLTTHDEPSFDSPEWSVLEDAFSRHLLLEYVVRNWVIHFNSSTLHGQNGELKLPLTFKDIFPGSSFFSLLEWSSWQRQMSRTDVTKYHDLALQIRKACFGEKHRSVMQTMIILAIIYRDMSNQLKAAEYFYHASIIGQVVIYKFSVAVVTCTSNFLACTQTLTMTKGSQILTYRITMIQLMIEICKHKHGANSDQVIKWLEVLAKLYKDIDEVDKSAEIYMELHRIIVLRYGDNHPRGHELFDILSGLSVTLTKRGSGSKAEVYIEDIFTRSGHEKKDNEDRIGDILILCGKYERSGKLFLAEKLYIDFWRRISEKCRANASVKLQLVKIKISLEYTRFLHRIKRFEEAQSILLCLWAEYEHLTIQDEELIIRIKELGALLKTFSLLTVAVSVFNKVWGWFKSRGKTTHEEALSTTILITEVVQEIEETTVTHKRKEITYTTTTETVVREIYETHFERCRHGKVDVHFFKACMALITLYQTQENWTECEVVIKRSLELTWKAVLTVDAKITLSGSYVKEIIQVATNLAICYHRQKYFEKAEEIYLRIHRACLASFDIDDACVTESSLVLIRFYEEYHRHDKVIEIYLELLHGYRQRCGASHHLTIQTLYALGSICLTLGHKDAYKYYIDIVTVLNKGSKYCHHDAFEAAILVTRHYHEEKRWVELRKICGLLWETFVHHHDQKITFTEEIITTLYERYIYVLEFHAKVEYSVLYKLTVEYRETVTKRFGASSAIVIKAMMALAIICEKHEEHYHEAIDIYEEIIKYTKKETKLTITIDETTITTVKRRVSKVYVTVITTGKSTSTTTIERGIAICLETYEQLKLEFGCWHEKTLTQLRELILLYHKQSKQESTIIRLLQSAVVETITTAKEAVDMYHAAATIASIYVSIGFTKAGYDLLHQLHHLIVLQDMASSTQITISIGKVSRISFVFLIIFEQALTSKPFLSFSEVMADILLEAYLYESYTTTIKSQTSLERKLQAGAVLYVFWVDRSRNAQADILARSLFGLFQSTFKDSFNVPETGIYTFFISILNSLGRDSHTLDFGHIVCYSAESRVSVLVKEGSFSTAHETAIAAFQLISARRYFHAQENVGYGYHLARHLAGLDTRSPTDPKLHAAMLATSRSIVAAILEAFRVAGIEFVKMKPKEISGFVRLLGAQENYRELEFLLMELWKSRRVRYHFHPDAVLRVGQALVHARFKGGHVNEAIELCDRICYNLKRSRGWLVPEAYKMATLLAELRTEQGNYAASMGVHEELLRQIDHDGQGEKTINAAKVNQVIELLKRDYARLGRWANIEHGYADLVRRVAKKYGVNVAGTEQWSKGSTDNVGKYRGIESGEWRIDAEMKEKEETTEKEEKHKRITFASRRSYGGLFHHTNLVH